MALHAEELAERLTGVVAFPITPFRRDESLDVDWDAFRVHVDFLAGAGVSALVVAGGTGEFSSLRAGEVIALARAAVNVAARRLPVLVAVGGSAAGARRAARAVAATGADGALVMPPAYSTPDPEALAGYYRAVAAAAPELGLAVCVCRRRRRWLHLQHRLLRPRARAAALGARRRQDRGPRRAPGEPRAAVVRAPPAWLRGRGGQGGSRGVRRDRRAGPAAAQEPERRRPCGGGRARTPRRAAHDLMAATSAP